VGVLLGWGLAIVGWILKINMLAAPIKKASARALITISGKYGL